MTPLTILVADDNYMVRLLARRLLQRHGYTVLEAADGEEALALLAAGARVALVLADVRMAPVTGIELYHELRRRAPAVRVVLMSGYPVSEAELPRGVLLLQKPFAVPRLLGLVEQAIGAA